MAMMKEIMGCFTRSKRGEEKGNETESLPGAFWKQTQEERRMEDFPTAHEGKK